MAEEKVITLEFLRKQMDILDADEATAKDRLLEIRGAKSMIKFFIEGMEKANG